MNIKGSVALVTGSNGGIGSAIVHELFERGSSKIYAAARKPESLADLQATYGDALVPVKVDITSSDDVEAAAELATDVTLLVNNAGISFDQGFLSAETLD